MSAIIALKVDVDTDRGTREGVPALVALFEKHSIPATFLFSLGPDNTGKAIRRIFRPGFFQKVSRTSVLQMYGFRTLLNGTLLPAPHIGRRNVDVMKWVRDKGFEVGIHCYDHFRWQDYLFRLSYLEAKREFDKAREEFRRIFASEALTAGAPGWQANANSRQIYDDANLLYSSDSRGTAPFFPIIEGQQFKTLEIPSTLPTFDELLGRPEYPDEFIPHHYADLLNLQRPNVFTLHAEIEGMSKLALFEEVLQGWVSKEGKFVRMDELAKSYLATTESIPGDHLSMATIDGRSGQVAVQGGHQ